MNIKEALVELFPFTKIEEKFEGEFVYNYIDISIYTTKNDLIFSEDIDSNINADIFIFASMHRSADNRPALTVHPIGNYIEKPAVFIEIGSTINEWQDKNSGKIIAKAIIQGLLDTNYQSSISAFGIGGQHYPSTFNKILLRTNYAIGHICPKYNLEFLDEEMIIQAMNKIIPKAELVILDWKGIGKEKQRIIDLLEKLKIKYERSDKILI